mgnify:CR=1 FL=1
MEVCRDRYLNNLIDRMHNGMIKVITGVRRCGKTYLLFELFGNYLRDELGVGDGRIGRGSEQGPARPRCA